jgi:hypothetical protein
MRNGKTADDAVEKTLDFVRNWAQFKIPTASPHDRQETTRTSVPPSGDAG